MTRGHTRVTAGGRLRMAGCVGIWTVLLGAMVAGNGVAYAQDALPSGADLMDRFVEVSGGKEAWLKLKNRVRVGTMEIRSRVTQMDTKDGAKAEQPKQIMDMTMYEAEPAETYFTRSGEEMDFATGTHNGMAWTIGFRGRAHIYEGEALKRTLHKAFFHLPVKWCEVFKEAKCEEEVEFDGEACYRVKLTSDVGEEAWYFSKETGLHRGTDVEMPARRRNIRLRMIFKDYREVDGVQMPYRIERVRRGQPVGPIVFTSIKHNVDLPPDRLESPAAVRELLEKRKAAEAEGEEKEETAKPEEGADAPAKETPPDEG